MREPLYIADLGKKIRLAISRPSSPLHTEEELIKSLSITKDYYARMKSGMRPVSEYIVDRLTHNLEVGLQTWMLSVEHFGRALGLSRREIGSIANVTLPGIDFMSRIRDPGQIQSLFTVIGGFWEAYYFSVSNEKTLAVSRDLVIIRKINDDNFIECDIIDGFFSYTGYCFPVLNKLYFILEKVDLGNEMMVCCMNIPDRRHGATLYGILLCVSGGIEDDTASYPASARLAFRYLGRTVEEVARNCAADIRSQIESASTLEKNLKESVPKYLYEKDWNVDETISRVVENVRNEIKAEQIPFALRMEV